MSSPRNQAGPRVGDRVLVKSDPSVFVVGVSAAGDSPQPAAQPPG
ncbi:MAG TPA: hypothetical protein VHT26_05590 [Trebonia sp.]|nr:hypothetical protein [Trebonia sp.]